jgi:hypothetical protein
MPNINGLHYIRMFRYIANHVMPTNVSLANMVHLVTTLLIEPFMKWGIDFIGPIKLPS